ncbi:MAG: hypothetical protein QG673_788 [Pseudomonadota bacterium]|nr:hypothetical protein [Pseudomonadota bacterium]
MSNYSEAEMDTLYAELAPFINFGNGNLINYDNDIQSIHVAIKNITQQVYLFTKGGIKFYSPITGLVLDCYRILQKITPAVEIELKNELISKGLQLFSIFTYLTQSPKTRALISKKLNNLTTESNILHIS